MEWRGVFGMFLYIMNRKVGVRSRHPNTENALKVSYAASCCKTIG
jgi:hypothetical protein